LLRSQTTSVLIAEGPPARPAPPRASAIGSSRSGPSKIANTSEAIFSSTLALELADRSGVDVAGDVEIVELGLDSGLLD
jgi:hypothetical protein